jgi:hypothetical protein
MVNRSTPMDKKCPPEILTFQQFNTFFDRLQIVGVIVVDFKARKQQMRAMEGLL